MSRHLSDRWESNAPGDKLIRGLLTPASWLYALGWQTYLAIYQLGIKEAKAPHRPIICIGNLVTGGTGKSPVTLAIARILKEMGHEVVIGASGYGSPAAEAAQLAPTGPLNAKDWGDEPAMIREIEPDIPLIVGRRRVLAAEICHEHFPKAVLLMDDGFQHFPVKKDLTILLDPPRKNRQCLPAGPYREPKGNRKRADLVIPGEFKDVSKSLDVIRQNSGVGVSPSAPPHHAPPDGRDAGDTIRLEGAKLSVLCALGQPERFLQSIREAGAEIVTQRLLPDHDRLDAGNLFDGLPTDLPVLVTLKDWVKLRERPDVAEREIWIAQHEISIEPNEEFRRWLATRMNEFTS